jgi:hypothetical protein
VIEYQISVAQVTRGNQYGKIDEHLSGKRVKRESAAMLWMGVAFGVALALAAPVLAVAGTDAEGLRVALRVTARWSFVLFWMAYAGGAVATLLGPAVAPLARRGREFGLAFASAHLVHIGLVVWLYQILNHLPLSGPLSAFFVIGIFWTYLLAALSFGGLSEALGRRYWHLVRFVGMNYILLAFARDFVPPVIRSGIAHQDIWRSVAYVPFAAMSVAAPLLVFAATACRRFWIRRIAA